MHNLRISASVLQKLTDKHKVSRREVEQCFENKCGRYLKDNREDHRTDPATLWFVAETNQGRVLKIIFIHRDGFINLRSAYPADTSVRRVYEAHGH